MKLLVFSGHTNWVRCCHWSPDEQSVVSGSNDETVRVWDSKTGALIVSLHCLIYIGLR